MPTPVSATVSVFAFLSGMMETKGQEALAFKHPMTLGEHASQFGRKQFRFLILNFGLMRGVYACEKGVGINKRWLKPGVEKIAQLAQLPGFPVPTIGLSSVKVDPSGLTSSAHPV